MGLQIALNYEQIDQTFREQYEGLGRYAYSILKNQDAAEDVVQKLFTTIWEKRNELEIYDLNAYLYRSVYNLSLNELKSLKRTQFSDSISEKADLQHSDKTNHSLLREELEHQIEDAMDKLPEKCGEVFRLSRLEELSYREISDRLNISIKTVENHMGKALKMMRNELKDYVADILLILLFLKGW